MDVDGPGPVRGGHLVVQIKQLDSRVLGERPSRPADYFAEEIKMFIKTSRQIFARVDYR